MSKKMKPFRTFPQMFKEAEKHREYRQEAVRIANAETQLCWTALAKQLRKLEKAKEKLRKYDTNAPRVKACGRRTVGGKSR